MVKQISYKKVTKFLLVSIFALFSLGQLPGFLVENYLFSSFSIHPLEALIMIFNLIVLLVHKKFPGTSGLKLIAILVFSNLLGSAILGAILLKPYLYLARIVNLIVFFYQLQIVLDMGIVSKKLLRRSLFSSALFVLVTSIAQYLLLPDMRFLYNFGWDDHLGRLVGLFFDPNFTGFILSILSIWLLGQRLPLKYKIPLVAVFTLSILATFSRTTYIVYFAVMFFYLVRANLTKVIVALLPLVVLTLAVLPRSMGGEGVNLLRTNSLQLRFQNLYESAVIITKSPVFGFGPGQLCEVRETFKLYSDSLLTMKNSCANFDFGPSNLVAIGGVALVLYLLGALIHSDRNLKPNSLFTYLFLAYFLHGLLTTTWIYPWAIFVLTVMFVLETGGKDLKLKRNS